MDDASKSDLDVHDEKIILHKANTIGKQRSREGRGSATAGSGSLTASTAPVSGRDKLSNAVDDEIVFNDGELGWICVAWCDHSLLVVEWMVVDVMDIVVGGSPQADVCRHEDGHKGLVVCESARRKISWNRGAA
jgi:hypothetical protein